MRFFRVWEIAAPLVMTPLAWLLWLRHFDGDRLLALAAIQIPIVFSYVLPALGTNVLGLWEIRGRWRLGRFRPHHGFVFGSAAALMALVALPGTGGGLAWSLGRAAFVLGSVFAFWNWLYDTYAIKAGFLIVYSRLRHQGASAETIATDYAPAFFGAFGVVYGLALVTLEHLVVDLGRRGLFGWTLAAANLAALTVPVLVHMALSRWRWGTWGLLPVGGGRHERRPRAA